MKRTILYAICGGLLLALLKFLEYKHFIRAYSSEAFGGLVAVIFTIVGVWLGLRLVRPKEVVIERVRTIDNSLPFALDGEKLRAFRITPRELEILTLIAAGLSNREIAERLFLSEHTVKSHLSRLFDKLEVKRRTQAVQKAKEHGLIP